MESARGLAAVLATDTELEEITVGKRAQPGETVPAITMPVRFIKFCKWSVCP